MPLLKRLGAAACVGLFALASCIPTPTRTALPLQNTPTATPNKTVLGSSNTFTAQQWADACQDIVVFDEAEAYKNAPPNEPILWTFGVNFKVLSPASNPVGCFKLYEINDQTKTYTLLDNFLVDTCSVTGPVTISPPTPVTFNGSGYVACAMNIADWVSQIKTAGKYPNQQALLESFYMQSGAAISFHDYANLTMAAQAGPTAMSENGAILMSYNPQGSLKPIRLDLQYESGGVSFGYGTCGSLPLPLSSNYYWWYDMRENVATQRIIYSPDYDGKTTVSQATGKKFEDCGLGKYQSPIQFWIGAATLYIGMDPANASASFIGEISGVLIDPTDSKPPI